MGKRKPKPKQKTIWSATQIKEHLETKFNAKNDKFWQWFFSEAPWGETNLLDLGDPEFYEFKDKKVNEYFAILKDEFYDKNNEEMEIENDL
jgi:hypothetical protein